MKTLKRKIARKYILELFGGRTRVLESEVREGVRKLHRDNGGEFTASTNTKIHNALIEVSKDKGRLRDMDCSWAYDIPTLEEYYNPVEPEEDVGEDDDLFDEEPGDAFYSIMSRAARNREVYRNVEQGVMATNIASNAIGQMAYIEEWREERDAVKEAIGKLRDKVADLSIKMNGEWISLNRDAGPLYGKEKA